MLFPLGEYWWFYGAFTIFAPRHAGSRFRCLSQEGTRSLLSRGDVLERRVDVSGAWLLPATLPVL